MKYIVYGLVALLLTAGVAVAGEKKVELKSDSEKLSYSMGLELGSYFKSLGEDLRLEFVKKGLEDAFNGNKPLLTAEEIAAIQDQFAARQREKQVKLVMEMAKKNRAAAEKFLAENKKKEGIQTTSSGLQYKVIKKGTGPRPKSTDTVKVHYRGSLLNGSEFDSSYKRNEPMVFQLNQVIPGWQEALGLMNVGSTYEVYLPPDLAYGDQGAPPVIEPGSLLIFQVELLGIENPAPDNK
ncbi:peptidyl-prolyl cis-trans isomerase [Desulfolithobacter dissulfuricans]|uniref:Peptidyl-prolyl cis-trans isomerase n=1 Tax=Desulfolithobacter dissulfuricans TaxID=2795293 RepID=A0A915XKZ1_9BACT|nr:FKBP-type peptidyl-prolyl cis-trans isomerase [Desulfolithobacter dissulfuricans]BCO09928.1 peptidyl-prolyl cis-trans isomerase [Desulfolithobacter dissulfuricans]